MKLIYTIAAIVFAIQAVDAQEPLKVNQVGPTSYGAPRLAGYVDEQVCRTVRKPVYERDVFKIVEEQVPFKISRTVMDTETRTRKVPKMIWVDEEYRVQVPRTVEETRFRTVRKSVKVGTEPTEPLVLPVPVATSVREVIRLNAPVRSTPPAVQSVPVPAPTRRAFRTPLRTALSCPT